MAKIDEIKMAVVDSNRKDTLRLVEEARGEGIPAMAVVNDGLVEGIHEVGRLFEAGKLFVPDMMLAAICVRDSIKLLEEDIDKAGQREKGLAVIGTIKGDLHDIGKNLVKMLWEAAGYRVIDLGVDVHEEQFVEAVFEHRPQIVGMSALLTTTLASIQEAIEALEAAGLRKNIKLAVGGAAVSESFAAQVKADGYARSGAAALNLLSEWFG